jgi:hypothetical protein
MVKRAAIPVPSDQEVGQEMALAQWRAQIRRLRLLVEQADTCAPAEFVHRVDEFMPELRKAAMRTVIHPASSDEKEK